MASGACYLRGGDWDFLSTNAKDAEVIGTVYDPEVTGAAAE